MTNDELEAIRARASEIVIARRETHERDKAVMFQAAADRRNLIAAYDALETNALRELADAQTAYVARGVELRDAEARLAEAERQRDGLIGIIRGVHGTLLDDRIATVVRTPDSASAAACNWRADDEGTWESDCGLLWCCEDATPSMNEMAYCPKCSKPLVEHPYVKPPVCGECGEELRDGKCPDCTTADQPTERVK